MITVQTAGGQLLTLQAPAARAFLEAERLNGRKLPWRKHRKPKAILITGQGYRACAYQRELYNSDPGRFADPDKSRHPNGTAVDVANYPSNLTRRARRCLRRVGFYDGISGEPWHFSFYKDGG
jgi:hypothetical protein